MRDDALSEHIGERKVSILKKLPPQEIRLLPNRSSVRISQPWASLPVMDVLPNTIYASEAFLPISLSNKDLPRFYVPFVDQTEARCEVASSPEAVESPFMLTNLLRC